jgi:hypothetical protein
MVNNEWAQLYRFPELGIGYYHADLQWDNVLGNVDAAYAFIKIPFSRRPRFQVNYSFAFGVARNSKYFDPEVNHFNIAIGSALNVYLNFGIEAQWTIRENLFFLLGIDLSHYSNGAIKKPNLGLNVPGVNIGVNYSVNQPPHLKEQIRNSRKSKKVFDVLLVIDAGWKEIHPAENNNYFTSSMWVDAGYIITPRKRMGLGLDLFYDASILSRMKEEGVVKEGKLNNLRQGAHISYDLIFGKVFFTIQAGYYFLVDWNDDGNLYTRFGLRYHHHRIIYNLSLKTHLGRADFIEWGVGYVLFQK